MIFYVFGGGTACDAGFKFCIAVVFLTLDGCVAAIIVLFCVRRHVGAAMLLHNLI